MYIDPSTSTFTYILRFLDPNIGSEPDSWWEKEKGSDIGKATLQETTISPMTSLV